MSQPSPEVPVNVLVELDLFDDAARALTDAGLRISAQNRDIGTIAGTVPAGQLGQLARLTGVTAVEEDGGFELSPPPSPQ